MFTYIVFFYLFFLKKKKSDFFVEKKKNFENKQTLKKMDLKNMDTDSLSILKKNIESELELREENKIKQISGYIIEKFKVGGLGIILNIVDMNDGIIQIDKVYKLHDITFQIKSFEDNYAAQIWQLDKTKMAKRNILIKILEGPQNSFDKINVGYVIIPN